MNSFSKPFRCDNYLKLLDSNQYKTIELLILINQFFYVCHTFKKLVHPLQEKLK